MTAFPPSSLAPSLPPSRTRAPQSRHAMYTDGTGRLAGTRRRVGGGRNGAGLQAGSLRLVPAVHRDGRGGRIYNSKHLPVLTYRCPHLGDAASPMPIEQSWRCPPWTADVPILSIWCVQRANAAFSVHTPRSCKDCNWHCPLSGAPCYPCMC